MAFTTRSSLLNRVRENRDEGWKEFSAFYTPFLMRVAERLSLRGQEVDEVVQAVLVDLFRGWEQFEHDRSRGRFRGYLKKVVVTRLSKMIREARAAGIPTEHLPETGSEELEQTWEEEYRQHALREALTMVRREVEPKTYQAFDLYALQGVDAREVARFLGISTAAVYTYKTRVLEKLRPLVQELMDP